MRNSEHIAIDANAVLVSPLRTVDKKQGGLKGCILNPSSQLLPVFLLRALGVLLGLFVYVLPSISDGGVPSVSGLPEKAGEQTRRIEQLQTRLITAVNSNLTDEAVAILREEPTLCNTTNRLRPELLVMQCARNMNAELVKAFVEAGAPINQASWQETTPLGELLEPMLNRWWGGGVQGNQPEDRNARLALAEYLLSKEASIFGPHRPGQTIIDRVYGSGDGGLVDFLLTNQVNHTVADQNGNTVIHKAATWGRTNALQAVAERGADLERTNNAGHTPLQAVARLPAPSSGSQRFSFRSSPALHSEGSKHRNDTFNLLLELGASPDLLSYIALGRNNEVADLLAREPQWARACDGSGASALHWAVEFGQLDAVEILLAAGAGLEAANSQGQTPLDLAAIVGHADVARLLIESGATLQRPTGARTPLHYAAERGFLDVVELVARSGADLEAECEGLTPLDFAARSNREQVVRFLIARKANLKIGGNRVTTPLHWAVANGNTNLIAFLLDQGSDIRSLDAEGRPPIHLAQARNNFELIALLLSKGANINARDTNGNTVLHLRATSEKDIFPAPPTALFRLSERLKSSPLVKQHMPARFFLSPPTRSMMELLLKQGATPDATNTMGQTPLHLVAQKRSQGTNATTVARQWMRPLLARRSVLNAVDARGLTPLHEAVAYKNQPVLQELIRREARVNTPARDGTTPLLMAVTNDQHGFYVEKTDIVAIVDALLQAGAGPQPANAVGMTPLHAVAALPAEDYRGQIVELLLRHRAPLNVQDAHGRTPLHWACDKDSMYPYGRLLVHYQCYPLGETNLVDWWYTDRDEHSEQDCLVPKMLLSAGAEPDVRDMHGDSPLHLAAISRRIPVIETLLSHDANRHITNHLGKTPIQAAYDIEAGFTVIPHLQPPGASSEVADVARRGEMKSLRAFLRDDTEWANWPWILGTTPLQWACNEGQTEAVRLLLESGAHVNPAPPVLEGLNLTNEMNRIRVYLGEMERRGVIPKTVLTPMARVDQKDDLTSVETNMPPARAEGYRSPNLAAPPLCLALAGGYTDIANLLLQHGTRVDPVSAVLLGRIDFLAKSIEQEPALLDRNYFRSSWSWIGPQGSGCGMYSAANAYEGTLLHYAVRASQYRVVQFLLESGAILTTKDLNGVSAFELAIKQDDSEMLGLFEARAAGDPRKVGESRRR